MEQEFKKLYEFLEVNMVTKDDAKDFTTKYDLVVGLQNMRDEITSVVATKYDINELKVMIDQLSIRTDEDLRAVMKDVELLKSR